MINDKTVIMVNSLGIFLNVLYCYILIKLSIEINEKVIKICKFLILKE